MQLKTVLKAFKVLLDGKGKGDLGEASDILPFLDANDHLCAMLLVIGRDRDLAAPSLRERFAWESDSVVVASKKVHCITYDKLYADLSTRLKIFGG